MAQPTRYQYVAVVGPVWTEAVAEKVTWLPYVRQPARTLAPHRLGDFASPVFAALYQPSGLQWLPAARYYGRPLSSGQFNWTVIDPTPPAAPFDPATLQWTPRDRYAGQPLSPNAHAFDRTVVPPFEPIYDPEGLQWLPSGQQPARGLAPHRIIPNAFDTKPIAEAPYDPNTLTWLFNLPYFGRSLQSNQYRDYSVVPPFEPLYDPEKLEWIPRGQQPRILVETRHRQGVSPVILEIATPVVLDWFPVDRYFGRSFQPNHYRDFTVTPPFESLYDPETLEWIPKGIYPRAPDERRHRQETSPVVFEIATSVRMDWLPSERYAGHSLPPNQHGLGSIVVSPVGLTTGQYIPTYRPRRR